MNLKSLIHPVQNVSQLLGQNDRAQINANKCYSNENYIHLEINRDNILESAAI